jgi:hypothetical protein
MSLKGGNKSWKGRIMNWKMEILAGGTFMKKIGVGKFSARKRGDIITLLAWGGGRGI